MCVFVCEKVGHASQCEEIIDLNLTEVTENELGFFPHYEGCFSITTKSEQHGALAQWDVFVRG